MSNTLAHDLLTADLVDAVALHARTSPDQRAVHEFSSGRTLSYAELDREVAKAAALLADKAGQRIAWLGQNSLRQVVTHLACSRAGAIFVPLNWRLAAPELARIIADAEPALLIHDTGFGDMAEALRDLVPALTAEDWANRCDISPPGGRTRWLADRPALLLYTSGTTGQPKGVVHSERSLFYAATNMAITARMEPRSVFLCDAPMFHVIGLVATVRTTLLSGATLLISQGFDAKTTLQRLSDNDLGTTHYFCVPAMAEAIRRESGFETTDLSHLTALCTGGAPYPPAAIRRWLDHGVSIANGYGMSESGSVTLMPPGADARAMAKAGSCGTAMFATEIRLVDEAGVEVPVGEAGEIWLRGPNLAAGYWNRPEETATAFADGWFRSGDIARCDEDGFYYLLDRKKDMFISGGENVYPAEVEAVIAEVDGIIDVAVIGVADEAWGEVGCAFLVAPSASALIEPSVRAHCNAKLARYKHPARYILLPQLPRSSTGKVDKAQLKTLAAI